MLGNASVTAFTLSELLRENERGRGGEGLRDHNGSKAYINYFSCVIPSFSLVFYCWVYIFETAYKIIDGNILSYLCREHYYYYYYYYYYRANTQ